MAAELGGGGTATYTYDGGGQRVRKWVERSAGEVVERVYVGGFERYRRMRSGQVVEASVTKHVAGSIVETWTHRRGAELAQPERIVRYQLNDRVGSSSIEIGGDGAVISVEEYFPFGQTAYSAASGITETSLKRYRFAGKERDEETGLYYIGARYYASWLGRWTAVDPLARGGPRNGYVYAANRPMDVVDPDGRDEFPVDRDMEAGMEGAEQLSTGEVNEAKTAAHELRQARSMAASVGSGTVAGRALQGALPDAALETLQRSLSWDLNIPDDINSSVWAGRRCVTDCPELNLSAEQIRNVRWAAFDGVVYTLTYSPGLQAFGVQYDAPTSF